MFEIIGIITTSTFVGLLAGLVIMLLLPKGKNLPPKVE